MKEYLEKLEKIDITLSILQMPESLSIITFELLEDYWKDGMFSENLPRNIMKISAFIGIIIIILDIRQEK